MMKYMALGAGNDNRVVLLCENHRIIDGTIEFFAINGAWWGRYNPWSGKVEVRANRDGPLKDEHPVTAKVLWQGTGTGDIHIYDYDRSMAWIEEALKRPWKHRLETLIEVLRDWSNYRLVVRFERKAPAKRLDEENTDLDDGIPW